jgi:hypothetical protein
MAQGKQLVGALLMVALCALPAWSQQKDPRLNQPVQPLPGVSSGESSSKGSPNAAGDQAGRDDATKPDTRPLSGAEQFSLGSALGRSTTFLNLHFRETADSNGASTGSGTDWASASLLSGDVGATFLRPRSEFHITYAGGGTLYNSRENLNESYHQAMLSEKILFRRWTLLLSDQAGYLPESSFGFGGLGLPGGVGGLGGFGGPFSNLNPTFDPSQSILTGRARRVTNTFVGEVQYAISPRSSFTATGSYGILRFIDDGFIDNTSELFSSGYNYDLDSRNTIGVTYSFTRFEFSGQNSGLQNHVTQLAYGRRITGRLALQLYGGPSFSRFQNSSVSTTGEWRISWSAGSLLRYQMPNGGVSLSYLRGVSGGAGIFAGSERDEIQVSADRKLGRQWAATVNFGYAHNSGLGQQLLSNAFVPSNFRFNSLYGGTTLNRTLGRRTSMYFNYALQRQSSGTSVCVSAVCGTTFLRHQFGLGLNWSLRPSEGR